MEKKKKKNNRNRKKQNNSTSRMNNEEKQFKEEALYSILDVVIRELRSDSTGPIIINFGSDFFEQYHVNKNGKGQTYNFVIESDSVFSLGMAIEKALTKAINIAKTNQLANKFVLEISRFDIEEDIQRTLKYS